MNRRTAASIAVFVGLAAFAFGPATAEDGGREARVLGDPDAPVTLIEFASMSCPHCARFHVEVLPGIKEAYIDTGKVKLEFRDFPLTAPRCSAARSRIAPRRSAISPGSI